MNAAYRTMLAAAGIVLAVASSSPAPAQDALGSGDVLDANLSSQSGRSNQAAARQDFRARNLLITSNVLGGRGFRGSVGYTAAADFRGALGSNDLYQFRADSAISAVNFISLGSTYEHLRFGQGLGLIEYDRAGCGATLRTITEGAHAQRSDIYEARRRLDQVSLASSISAASAKLAEPANIGYTLDEEGKPYLISTSSLRGLSTRPMQQNLQLLGLSTFDAARLLEDRIAGRGAAEVGIPFAMAYEDLAQIGQPSEREPSDMLATPGVIDTRIDPAREPQFRRILERVAQRYAEREQADLAEQPELYRQLDEDLQRLRGLMEPAAPSAEEQPEPAEEEPEPGGIEDLRPELPEPGLPQPADDEEEEDRPAPLQAEQFGTILRHGQRIESLSTGDEGRFNELVTSAEVRLHDGEYFWAERRFNRALRLEPGHPLATAGLAHAQIGGGLYLSASLTLHSLFVHQPEMIDARYDAALVPNRLNLLKAVDKLKGRLDGARDRASSAFLLAYIARLLDDRPLIESSLAVMAETAPDDPLAPLLHAIWLAEDEETAEPDEPEK